MRACTPFPPIPTLTKPTITHPERRHRLPRGNPLLAPICGTPTTTSKDDREQALVPPERLTAQLVVYGPPRSLRYGIHIETRAGPRHTHAYSHGHARVLGGGSSYRVFSIREENDGPGLGAPGAAAFAPGGRVSYVYFVGVGGGVVVRQEAAAVTGRAAVAVECIGTLGVDIL